MATAFMEEYSARQHWQCPGCDDRGAEEPLSCAAPVPVGESDALLNDGAGAGLALAPSGVDAVEGDDQHAGGLTEPLISRA